MAVFSTQHLQKVYSWTEYKQDDPKITGLPDDVRLNKNEGNEVLAFIRQYMADHQLSSIEDGQKVERKIHYAPGQCKSRKELAEWIFYWFND
jgi:hypothetical protein